jgi:acyl-coenzyme A thioesterase PaaI-like protein
MHGGLVTTVADELAAWTIVLMRDKFGFTAEIQAKLHRPLRTGVPAEGRGRIVRESRRVVRVGVALTQAGARVFEGELAFVLLDRGGAQQLLGGEISEVWQRYCR